MRFNPQCCLWGPPGPPPLTLVPTRSSAGRLALSPPLARPRLRRRNLVGPGLRPLAAPRLGARTSSPSTVSGGPRRTAMDVGAPWGRALVQPGRSIGDAWDRS